VAEHLPVSASRIRVVPHGVHLPASRSPGGKEKVILHIGAIQRRKNVVRLVEAFEACPSGWSLVLAGSVGYGGSEIIERIEASPRRDGISITGYLPDDQMARQYARASILAFPSLAEGFGLPVLEAMANGVAVLTSNGSALKEVAGDAAVLVDPHETDSIREGLMSLMESEELRVSYAEKGFVRAKEFTWEHTAGKTWSVYEELLG
jgi:alpha-1,3-rhamnosyl/mannosyltransferase